MQSFWNSSVEITCVRGLYMSEPSRAHTYTSNTRVLFLCQCLFFELFFLFIILSFIFPKMKSSRKRKKNGCCCLTGLARLQRNSSHLASQPLAHLMKLFFFQNNRNNDEQWSERSETVCHLFLFLFHFVCVFFLLLRERHVVLVALCIAEGTSRMRWPNMRMTEIASMNRFTYTLTPFGLIYWINVQLRGKLFGHRRTKRHRLHPTILFRSGKQPKVVHMMDDTK